MLLIVNMELYRTSSKDPTKIKKVKMSAGKAAAQASHATLGAYRRAVKQCPRSVSTWLNGQMKITVKCPTVINTPAACLGSAALEPSAAIAPFAPSIHRLLIFALLPALLLPHQLLHVSYLQPQKIQSVPHPFTALALAFDRCASRSGYQSTIVTFNLAWPVALFDSVDLCCCRSG